MRRTIPAGALKRSLAAVSIAVSVAAMSACSEDPAPPPQPLAAAAAPEKGPGGKVPNTVPCDNKDFARIEFHPRDNAQTHRQICFANSGEGQMPPDSVVDTIFTGNNNVQYVHGGVTDPPSPGHLSQQRTTTFTNGGLGIQVIRMNI